MQPDSINPTDTTDSVAVDTAAVETPALADAPQWVKDLGLDDWVWTSIMAVAAFLGLILAIFLINRFFRWVYKKVRSWKGTRIKGMTFRGYEFLSPHHATEGIVGGLRIFRLLLLLTVFYFWLPLIFSIFPWTETWADQLLELVLNPLQSLWHDFVAYLPSLFFVIVVLFVTRRALRIVKFFVGEVEKSRLNLPGFHKEWARPTFNLARILVYVFVLVIIFPYLPGSESPAFQGVSIFLGVLLSLGSTSLVGNAVGGLMLIYMRPFTRGDVVKIANITGTIVEKNLLVTRITTPKNEDITLPNMMVSNGEIVNYSSDAVKKGIFLHVTITLGYDVPWRTVHEVLIAAAEGTEGILPDPKPFVLQTALNDFNVAYELNAYTNQAGTMARTYSNLHAAIQDGCNAAGIEILSPHFNAVRDGNESTIPEEQRPEAPPTGFRIFPWKK